MRRHSSLLASPLLLLRIISPPFPATASPRHPPCHPHLPSLFFRPSFVLSCSSLSRVCMCACVYVCVCVCVRVLFSSQGPPLSTRRFAWLEKVENSRKIQQMVRIAISTLIRFSKRRKGYEAMSMRKTDQNRHRTDHRCVAPPCFLNRRRRPVRGRACAPRIRRRDRG